MSIWEKEETDKFTHVNLVCNGLLVFMWAGG
jgi:hypothetical protein